MRCPQCGTVLPDAGVATCPSCGLRLDEVRDLTPGELESAAQREDGVVAPSPIDIASPPVSLPGGTQAETVPEPPAPTGAPTAFGGLPEDAQPSRPPPYAPYAPYPSAAASSPRQSRRGGRIALIVTLTVVAVLLICGGSGIALFSYAQSHRLLGAAPTATIAIAPTPTLTSFVIYQNSLATKAAGWPDSTHCAFKADGYHIFDAYACFAPVGQLGSVEISADVRQISGSQTEAYGISFRYATPPTGGPGNSYEFGVDSRGEWFVWKSVNGRSINLANNTASTTIKTGPDATNLLSARAVNQQFDFYINGTFVGHVDDSNFTGGYVGTTGNVGVAGCTGCDVLASNVVVSELSQL